MHGSVSGQGFVEGLDVAGVQGRLVLDVEQFGDFVEIGFSLGGIGIFRHDGPPVGGFVAGMMGQG